MALFNTLSFITNHPLNRAQKARTLIRFVKWQIGSRLVPGQVIYDWINGSKIIVRTGETGLTGNIYCGLHEFEDMAYLLHALSPEDLFVDIGANVGSYTILACSVRGAKGICFEPVPDTYERLLDNIGINKLSSQVEALNLGLSDKEDELSFTSSESCCNHVVASGEEARDAIRVKVFPLDTVLRGRSPSLLKIDVEGFETPVLSGAHATLSNKSLHSVILELNGSGKRYGYDEKKVLDTMSKYGFLTYVYEPFSRELRRLGQGQMLAGNTLFIRNVEVVKEKIEKSPYVLVNGVRL